MDRERFRRIKEIFVAALEASPEERPALLGRECGEDPDLRGEVEELLEAHAAPAQALDRGVSVPSIFSAENGPSGEPRDHPTSVGRYRIHRLLGEGAMGSVYEAEQDRPRRRVALKLLRDTLYSSKDLRRFEVEAEVLARLHHPGIAQIHDAGMAEVKTRNGSTSRRPFFAMELIEGETLLEHATSRSLGSSERLELVARVCDAVEHGHRRGVIHRDIKPANVIVDGSGQPKIIDFGVARATFDGSRLMTLQTVPGQIVGTVPYMSPEQVQGDPSEIDTRSDVYSLGVVAYELLTERLPYDLSGKPLVECLRLIQDAPPCPPGSVDRELRGDVEAILGKALEKDPTRRYDSAGALALDIRRHLEGETVSARSPTALEQIARWSRRHRSVFLSLVTVVAVLLIATVVSVFFALLAFRSRDEAEFRQYRASIAAAQAALRVPDVASARRSLLAAPRDLRGWEWRYLLGRLDSSVQVISVGEDQVTAVDFAPGGELMVLSGNGGDVRQTLRRFTPGGDRSSDFTLAEGIRRFDFSASGERLATLDPEGRIEIRDLDSGESLLSIDRPSAERMALAPGGEWIALASGNGILDGAVWTIDAATGDLLGECVDVPGLATSLMVSPSGDLLATSHLDATVRIWNPETGAALSVLEGHDRAVVAVAFHPSGRILASAGTDRTVRVWDLATGTELAILRGHATDVLAVDFDVTGEAVVSGSADGTVRIWSWKEAYEPIILHGHENWVMSVRTSPDGEWVVTGSLDGTARLWRLRNPEEERILRGHTGIVRGLSVSPDGKLVASASFDRTVRIWDLSLRSCVGILEGHEGRISRTAFDREGRRLASSSNDGTVRLWRLPDFVEERVLTHGSAVHSAAFGPGALLAAAGKDGLVSLWNVDTGERLASLEGHTDWLWSVAFDPGGDLLASASRDETVILWDVEKRQEVGTLRGHTGSVEDVVFSGDGTLLATASSDGTVRVWETESRATVAVLTGHAVSVESVAFSPDGCRLVSASMDRTLELWDCGTWESLLTLRGHTHWIWGVAFTPDGRRIVSAAGSYGASDCTVRIWEAID